MPLKLGSTAAALVLCLTFAAPVRAAGPAEQELKSQIDGVLNQLETLSHGMLKWEGAERMDIRQDGEAAIADIANARISIGSPEAKPGQTRAQISFDHVEIRRSPGPEGAAKLAVVLPRESTVQTTDSNEVKLTLKDATGEAVVDAKSGRARESTIAFAGARLADKKSGDWVAFGPLALSYKLVGGADGSWTTPVDFELKQTEFFFTEGPVGGAIDRISYTARSAGPDLAALNRMRDRLDGLREKGDAPPKERLDALLDLLPTIPSLFSQAKGELTIEGLVARAPTGEPYVAVAKASMGGALTGMSGDAAALRITLQHDGLTLAPAILEAAKVPHRAVMDFGLEDVGTGPLRSILEAAGKMREGASEADKQNAQQQMIGAAAMLNPVFRIYDLAVDTPDVGIDATAAAKGSPLSPKGYTAEGDVAVRGFDALPGLVGDVPLAPYLPLLKEIGTEGAAADGTKRTKFHLASAPQKWITLNGSDVSAWFAGNSAAAGQPRALRPAEPAITGADVSAVQRALAAAKIDAPQSGVYDGATAAAVARFQKQNTLNIDGVVDAAIRQKLGIKAEPPQPNEPKPRPATPGRR